MSDEASEEVDVIEEVPRPRGRRQPAFNPMQPPTGVQIELGVEEWRLIHGSDPSRVYELRPTKRRPSPPIAGMIGETPNGLFGSFPALDPPCARCATRIGEVISIEGTVRCLGCGNAPMTVRAKA